MYFRLMIEGVLYALKLHTIMLTKRDTSSILTSRPCIHIAALYTLADKYRSQKLTHCT